MIIRNKKSWKEYVDNKAPHKGITRRDLIERGLATGVMMVTVQEQLFGSIISDAYANVAACPPPTRALGAIAQLYAEGGATVSARVIGEIQAGMMNADMASKYGISGQANLVQFGSNFIVDQSGAFGFTLMQGPPGYPGGPIAWQNNVLRKVSVGAHMGPFNKDDGAGRDTGLVGGVSPFKTSQMGKDVKIGVNSALAMWANGLPSSSVSRNNLSPTSLANVFTLTPAAAGRTTSAEMTRASEAANALAQVLDPVFGTSTRKGHRQLASNVGCSFYANSSLADPNFGQTLFNPNNIAALTSRMTVAQLSNAEQALLAAHYQSASGVAGSVVIERGGRDYHDADPQNTIQGAQIEEARDFVMFLAACEAAQAPGAMIYLSNGHAIANGVQQTNATINGQATTVNTSIAVGDAGGTYNIGFVMFYNPNGTGPQTRFTGTITDNSGKVRMDPNVGSDRDAVAGLYLSALKWINGGNIPDAALRTMQKVGVASNPSKVLVV